MNNNGYYWIDDCEDGEYIFNPSKPTRKGYAFTGWYTDIECNELYDIENEPFSAEIEELILYAGWQEN